MKKICSIIGIVAGVFIILIGLLTSFGAFGVADSYATSAPYYYDSGFAEFGADYYTYSVNNSAEAAYAARAATDNIRAFSAWIQTCIGLFLIFIGVVDICGFGIVFASCSNIANNVPELKEETNYVKWTCDFCGVENSSKDRRCGHCGNFMT